MKKIGEIAPWSFYRNDNGPDIIETADTKESELSNLRKQLGQKNTGDIKDFHKLNLLRVNEMNNKVKQKSVQKNYVQSYRAIINTSPEMIASRDEDISFNNRYLLLVAIRQCLKMENREKQVKKVKQKYECLFPILKPRQSLQLRKAKAIKAQFPSQIAFQSLISSLIDF